MKPWMSQQILQVKKIYTALHGALSVVDSTKRFKRMLWSENYFDKFYKNVMITAQEDTIDQQELPVAEDLG